MSADGTTDAPLTLLVVGDGDVTAALEAISHTLGWKPVVVSTLGETLAALPGCDSVVVLSHHGEVDGPAIAAALDSGKAYVGAMGSRKTQARRRDWMLANGTSVEAADTVRGPAGLDIGANTPAEIALSIAAEIVAVHRRSAGTGAAGVAAGSLSSRSGPIHADLEPGTAECPAG